MTTALKYIKVVCVHVIFWCCFLLVPIVLGIQELGVVSDKMLLRPLMGPVLFYINFLILVPKLLLRKHITAYVFVSLIILFLANYVMSNYVSGTPLDRLENLVTNQDNPNEFRGLKVIVPFAFSMSVFLLGGMFRVLLTYFRNENNSKQLVANKKEIEIQFLRTQLNPHFLFNSLNSIYSLVRSGSNDASEAVITLSELMRYMLYEVKDEKMPLVKELDYIKNYIALQRLRIKDNSGVKSNIHGDASDLFIEPLILVSFIENAFKYGTNFKGETQIEIYIDIKDNLLHFFVKNVVGMQQKKSKDFGIGLSNIKDQLSYLYEDKHELNILQKDGYFIVDLILKLK